eukprot:352338-Chlamydomonas_euryale.AAC.13
MCVVWATGEPGRAWGTGEPGRAWGTGEPGRAWRTETLACTRESGRGEGGARPRAACSHTQSRADEEVIEVINFKPCIEDGPWLHAY